jgi:hypothetical protein
MPSDWLVEKMTEEIAGLHRELDREKAKHRQNVCVECDYTFEFGVCLCKCGRRKTPQAKIIEQANMIDRLESVQRVMQEQAGQSNDSIERQGKEIVNLRTEIVSAERFDCDSCGYEIIGKKDDYVCRGCGAVVCLACVNVFQHIDNERHGSGNPYDEVDRLRKDAAVDLQVIISARAYLECYTNDDEGGTHAKRMLDNAIFAKVGA